ncbi:MAG: DUF5367 family protein [Flavobacteriaceae bacterium]
MKTIRALLTATTVWILGVSTFIISYYVPLMDDLDLQANIALSLSLIPLGWLGSRFYYLKYQQPNGFVFGLVMVFTAIILDALLTVPLMILPIGGTYLEFFSAPAFWLIATEYYLVVLLYWWVKVKPASLNSIY